MPYAGKFLNVSSPKVQNLGELKFSQYVEKQQETRGCPPKLKKMWVLKQLLSNSLAPDVAEP